ncbi:PD-(D/E)XK nuclease family protein [Alkaliphilus hydrothermalis]|uniref:PD-(D/E)XK endonuclease-like domain-containing protein n=1 Tax=Alkaliphilus hydrothermalis TaxID=1482730 RepID=A0ABS2NS09_9FIRM|nr:PD-(D/E)XK nuclease family protein [Alkaliphilus hydrothermalis]MBM7615738.1 hypothetical protein [Alkaliphilus hydrothermalis]
MIKVKSHIAFGNSIHTTLADYNQVTNKGFKRLDLLHTLLHKNWISDGYGSPIEEKEFWNRGLGLLNTYHHNPLDQDVKNLIIESMLYKETDNFILCGKLDKVYERSDHVIEVLDYKTGSLMTPMGHIQLLLYLILTEANLGVRPQAASLYYLPENRSKRKFQYT